MNAQEDLESSLRTSHHRSVSRMAWARIRHQYEQRVQDLCDAGKGRDDARRAALDTGALRSFISGLLTRCSREAVGEFLRTRSDWGTGAALIEKDWSVVGLIDQIYPVATWTALDPIDAGSAADDARWAAWVQAWHDEFKRDHKPSEDAHARVFGHSPRVDEDGVQGRRDDMFDGVVLKPELSPRMKEVLNWGALIATFFVNLADEEEDEDEELDRRSRRWTRRQKKARDQRVHPLDEVLKDGGVEMPQFVDIVGQFLGGTDEARETAEMIARSPDPHKLLRVFVERFANPRADHDDVDDEQAPPSQSPPREAAGRHTATHTQSAPPCSPPPPPGGAPKWAENLDAHLRARGLGHIADTARVSAASPSASNAAPQEHDLDKILETVADKAAAKAVQAIRPMIEQYTASVEKCLKEQGEEIRGLAAQMRDQEARLRQLEAEFRVLHAEVEKSKIADAESKARASGMMEQPESTPEPISVVIAEPVAPPVEAAPVVVTEVVEEVSSAHDAASADPAEGATGDALHAAVELEKLAGVTGLRSALGDVQQGIGDLKAHVATNDSLIKEMEAKLAEARRQKEEASGAR